MSQYEWELARLEGKLDEMIEREIELCEQEDERLNPPQLSEGDS